MLEDKLKNIQKKTHKKLKQGAISQHELYSLVGDMLTDYGLLDKNPYNKETRVLEGYFEEDYMLLNLASKATFKSKARRHDGLKNVYFNLKKKKLNPEIVADIDNYNSLSFDLKAFLQEKIGDSEVSAPDLLSLTEDYVESRKQELGPEIRKGLDFELFGKMLPYFKVKKEKEKLGNTYKEDFEEALNKL